LEIKCQLDATDEFLLKILLLAQHVSGTIMPIIRSSRVVAACHIWCLIFKLLVWCGVEGCVSGLRAFRIRWKAKKKVQITLKMLIAGGVKSALILLMHGTNMNNVIVN
jgi:hypothetical protein